MLRIKIEIVPYGIEENTRVLHTINIGNVGGTPQSGNYSVWVDTDPREFPVGGRPIPDMQLKNFKRDLGAGELSRVILNGLKKSKNKIFNKRD